MDATIRSDARRNNYGEPYTAGDLISVGVDTEKNVIEFFKNGRSQCLITDLKDYSGPFFGAVTVWGESEVELVAQGKWSASTAAPAKPAPAAAAPKARNVVAPEQRSLASQLMYLMLVLVCAAASYWYFRRAAGQQ